MRISPRITETIGKIVVWMAAAVTLLVVFAIVLYLVIKGFPELNLSFLLNSPEKLGKGGGIFPTIVGTIILTTIALIVATPLGVGTAIYLTEYTEEGVVTKIIRFGAESLAGIPSIIFGLFGFIFFVIYLGLGWSILSGSLTIAFMVLPTIIRTSEEAIKAVPVDFREVSLSLGATKWETVSKIVLPSAAAGIVTGIILSVGRAVGETAAVIFTAGTSLRIPASIFDSTRTMAVHFYILAREGISLEKAYGTAAILILAILVINLTANWLTRRFVSRYG